MGSVMGSAAPGAPQPGEGFDYALIGDDGRPVTAEMLEASADRLMSQQWVKDWIANLKPIGGEDSGVARQ